jgi:hypothetical protein
MQRPSLRVHGDLRLGIGGDDCARNDTVIGFVAQYGIVENRLIERQSAVFVLFIFNAWALAANASGTFACHLSTATAAFLFFASRKSTG